MKSYILDRFEHVQLVQANMIYLIENHAAALQLTTVEKLEMAQNALQHDSSCFDPKIAFVLMKCHNQYGARPMTTEQFEIRKDAIWMHYTAEKHHLQGNQNPSKVEAIQMACDIQATEHRLGLSPLDYFDKMLQFFTKDETAKHYIRRTLKILDRRHFKLSLSFDELEVGKTYEVSGTHVEVKIVEKQDNAAKIEMFGSSHTLTDAKNLKFIAKDVVE